MRSLPAGPRSARMANRRRSVQSNPRAPPSPVHGESHLCYDPLGGGIMARSSKKDAEDGIKVICRNKRAFHEYVVLERMECGLMLTGTEVKSLRAGVANLEDAYAKIEDGELWLIGSDI